MDSSNKLHTSFAGFIKVSSTLLRIFPSTLLLKIITTVAGKLTEAY